ncbi:FAD:protein FMN transferase [Rhodococcus tibetensis]|uniref:FAD:protein FMN transferase n=1 Tax=Rhodococcus tibetensis TaxID=2965064 RepID=A0ABT1QJF4_9NOCA|nr:FAD:protein FMN transferase [Rhodococcus sp. FXJ9.536]MCQ4122416.1 FAD:protein FMN transferase [Rhodococcus sp. FXJ9.536]
MSGARSATEWSTWGVHARVVVTDPAALDSAANLVRGYLAAADAAVNRERSDAEIHSLRPGRNTVTPLFARFIADALSAAQTTDGKLDPTSPAGAHSWRSVGVDGTEVTLPEGVELDLTSTARASSADHCASTTAELLGCGVLVALGGDIATAGTTPPGGWQVQVQDLPGDPTCQVSIPSGAGVATASTVKPLHPDPIAVWRTVSVVADCCTTAHGASSAAVAMGGGAVDWLTELKLPARLVDQEFRVSTLGGWPH